MIGMCIMQILVLYIIWLMQLCFQAACLSLQNVLLLCIIGFATPNPLPHQVRGGVLGSMQLRMAKQEGEHSVEVATKGGSRNEADKASKDVVSEKVHVDQSLDSRERQRRMAADEAKRRKKARQAEAPRQATMNLSDSSSSSSEDESDESE
jgi:hypothetical protein